MLKCPRHGSNFDVVYPADQFTPLADALICSPSQIYEQKLDEDVERQFMQGSSAHTLDHAGMIVMVVVR
jgi:hypothetical protein